MYGIFLAGYSLLHLLKNEISAWEKKIPQKSFDQIKLTFFELTLEALEYYHLS